MERDDLERLSDELGPVRVLKPFLLSLLCGMAMGAVLTIVFVMDANAPDGVPPVAVFAFGTAAGLALVAAVHLPHMLAEHALRLTVAIERKDAGLQRVAVRSVAIPGAAFAYLTLFVFVVVTARGGVPWPILTSIGIAALMVVISATVMLAVGGVALGARALIRQIRTRKQ